MLTKWITWWGLSAHVIWGVVTLYDPQAMYATPLSSLAEFFNRSQYALSFALISSAIASYIAMATHKRPDLRTLMLLVPQQFFMLIAAGGAVAAIFSGAYADGVQRSVAFILADQIPWILAALLYTFAILEHFGRAWKASGLQ